MYLFVWFFGFCLMQEYVIFTIAARIMAVENWAEPVKTQDGPQFPVTR